MGLTGITLALLMLRIDLAEPLLFLLRLPLDRAELLFLLRPDMAEPLRDLSEATEAARSTSVRREEVTGLDSENGDSN